MKKLYRYLICVLVVMFVVSGCSKKPTMELDETKNAVESAKSTGSEKYLPDESEALDNSLESALSELETQDSKFVLFRNYKKATEMLADVKTKAEVLNTNTVSKKEELKNSAAQAQESAKTAINDAKILLAQAPTGKETRLDLELMKGDITGLEESIPEVQQLIDSENYQPAIDKSNNIKDKANGVSDQIKQAIEKVSVAGKKGE